MHSLRHLIATALSLTLCSTPLAADPSKPATHTDRKIEGWTVRVDDRLLEAEAMTKTTSYLKSLESRLFNISIIVGEPQLGQLRNVTIVMDQSHGELGAMQYHPGAKWLKDNGYDEKLVRCVHLPKAASLIEARQINVQPWVILHELAHAYHDQILGFDEKRVIAAYKKFKASGHGDHCLHTTGKRVSHYGLTDHKEFFAEMTEAYFGTNDFFPFNRGELIEHEPEIHELMKTIWEPERSKP